MNSPRLRRATARLARALPLAALLLALPLARPAPAACHIAAFTDDAKTVRETAGRVTLTVELTGRQPSCAGTVRYQTVDGTAKAGRDYRAREGTLSFAVGDDREESFSIPILNDSSSERTERFTVRLSGGTGTISADDTATVSITDNDEPPESPGPTQRATTPPTSPTGDSGSNAGLIAAIVLALAALGGGGVWLLRRRA